MRLAYLSADRIELQFASKKLARSMVEPTTADVEALKRCICFLLEYPRCIQSFERKEDCAQADHVQQRLKLRWMSAEQEEHEKHLLKSTSTTQAVVSLSSAEAEFSAAVKGQLRELVAFR